MDQKARIVNRQGGPFGVAGGERLPVWVSPSSYYLLVVFFAAALFFIVWAGLHDGYDDSPLVIAGISAVVFIVGFVLFREVVLRRSRARALAARRLSSQLRLAAPVKPQGENGGKLTLEQNEIMLREIRTKSDAAKVLGKLADAHKEVFDLCDGYMRIVSAELETARPGSPRVPAFRRGMKTASSRHRLHMLKWAELKAMSFTSEANNGGPLGEKIEAGEKARDAVATALGSYPQDPALTDSLHLLDVFLISSRVRRSMDEAELAHEGGSGERAEAHYREALAELERSEVQFAERQIIRERLQFEIGRIGKTADL